MDIKVDLSAEQINTHIASAIADSAIGVELKRAIEAEVTKLSQSFNNPFQSIISNHIRREVERIGSEDYSEEIKAVVKEKVTADFTTEMMESLWNAWESQKGR